MISKKLIAIFGTSIPVIILHGLEEYYTGFFDIDWSFNLLLGPLHAMDIRQATFLEFQFALWILLSVVFLVLRGRRFALGALSLLGIMYILEIQHLLMAAVTMRYYPGAFTAVLFLPIAFFFWKELVKEWRSS